MDLNLRFNELRIFSISTSDTKSMTKWSRVVTCICKLPNWTASVTIILHLSVCVCVTYYVLCSVAKSCPAFCNPTVCSTSGFPVIHYLPEIAQVHVHWVGDGIQPSHPLLPPLPFAFHLSQHQSLFEWVSSSHQVAKVLELQLQSFQWTFRLDFI